MQWHSISTFTFGTFLAAIMLLSSGCSAVSIYRGNVSRDPFLHEKERPLGFVALRGEDESAEPPLHLYKIRKGYALKSHIDSGEGRATHAMLSKDKNRKWFAGFEWKWSF